MKPPYYTRQRLERLLSEAIVKSKDRHRFDFVKNNNFRGDFLNYGYFLRRKYSKLFDHLFSIWCKGETKDVMTLFNKVKLK